MNDFKDPIWQAKMRLLFDFNNMMSGTVGEHGISDAEIARLETRAAESVDAVQTKRGSGWLGWMELPYQPADLLNQIKTTAEEIRKRCDDFVVLGIGGSALGSIALRSALLHPWYNQLLRDLRDGPRLYILDNVDPHWLSSFLDLVNPESTCINVVSKSGSTAETMSEFLWMRQWLKDGLGCDYADHIVATTDAHKGALRAMADAEGLGTLTIPDGVGGRFSVLSPVGLLPAAVAGIDIGELLAGAAYADDASRSRDMWRNQSLMMAALAYLSYRKGKNVWVMMPYIQALRDVADWFRQLWAESLGKAKKRDGSVVHVGQTPIKALGTTDQHSQVQLYVEGPYDKVVHFIRVEDYGARLGIPAADTGQDALDYLGGHSFEELINAEQEATALALASAGRPNCTHTLPEVNAFTMGELLYTLEMATAYSGELYDIDAFDQPGVEAGKVATYALLGRRGYESKRREIEQARSNPKYVIEG